MPDQVIRVPRETTEFQAVEIRQDGILLTEGLEYTITPYPARPVTWAPMETQEGKVGFTITDMDPGTYGVWVKHNDDGAAVRMAGLLVIE